MAEKEFDQLTPEEKKARFQKALDDYNSGFVEVDYALRSVASIRLEEALEDAGRGLEEFKPAQRRVLFEAAKADLNLEHYMNPKFSASHMKFIMEQEMAGKDLSYSSDTPGFAYTLSPKISGLLPLVSRSSVYRSI